MLLGLTSVEAELGRKRSWASSSTSKGHSWPHEELWRWDGSSELSLWGHLNLNFVHPCWSSIGCELLLNEMWPWMRQFSSALVTPKEDWPTKDHFLPSIPAPMDKSVLPEGVSGQHITESNTVVSVGILHCKLLFVPIVITKCFTSKYLQTMKLFYLSSKFLLIEWLLSIWIHDFFF